MRNKKLRHNKDLTKAIDEEGRKYIAKSNNDNAAGVACRGCVKDSSPEYLREYGCFVFKCTPQTARMTDVVWQLRSQ